MHPKSFRALSRALFAATAIAALATATAVSAAPAWTNVPVLQEHVAVKYRGAEASTELAKVFHDSDEAQLKLGPIGALMRGDPRYHDQFGDYLSDDYIAATEAAYETDWRRLHEIDRASLSPEEQIAYDVFEWQTKLSLEGNTPSIVAATIVRPIDHFTGVAHAVRRDQHRRFHRAVQDGEGLRRWAFAHRRLRRVHGQGHRCACAKA